MVAYTKVRPTSNQLRALYGAVGWTAYTSDIPALNQAFAHSVYITAWQDTELVGLIRGITDHQTILYIQDLLVLPNFQHQGIATELMQQLMAQYPTGQTVLLTDDNAKTNGFYHAVGMRPVAQHGLRAFFKDTR